MKDFCTCFTQKNCLYMQDGFLEKQFHRQQFALIQYVGVA